MTATTAHALGFAAAVVLASALPAAAQRPPAPGQFPPYKPPRIADGKPDLNGIWQALNTAAWDLEDHSGALHTPPGQGVAEGGGEAKPPKKGGSSKKILIIVGSILAVSCCLCTGWACCPAPSASMPLAVWPSGRGS